MAPELPLILEQIDRATDPSRMSLQEAKEFLERLATEIEVRIDGVKDSIADWAERDDG